MYNMDGYLNKWIQMDKYKWYNRNDNKQSDQYINMNRNIKWNR